MEDESKGKTHVDMDDPLKGSTDDMDDIEKDEEYDDVVIDMEEFDSGDDSEFESTRKKALHKLKKLHKGLPIEFYVGQQFGCKEYIKKAVTEHAVQTRRDLGFIKNDKTRMRVICKGVVLQMGGSRSGGPNTDAGGISGPKCDGAGSSGPKCDGPKSESICPWVLHISTDKRNLTWTVKTYRETHTCLKSRQVKQCTATFLSQQVQETIVPNPDIPMRALAEGLAKKYEVRVTNMKAYRAKTIATKKVRGDFKEQYADMRDYVLELKKVNPGTIVKL